jgi:uncharacterized protein
MAQSMIEAISSTSEGLEPLLALNNAHAADLSWLALDEFRQLIATGFRVTRLNQADALMIALDQTADYASPNFHWFRERYPRFVYVDRVVVAETARGLGAGRALYEDLFEAARDAGHTVVTCEVNLDPPNLASDAFHARLGFGRVGEAAIHGGKKRVSYYAREL